jgi:hypothetical protein
VKHDIRRSLSKRKNAPGNPERTICDVHREAYVLARDAGDGVMMALIAEAFDMGKRMNAKLYEYHKDGFAGRGLRR